MTSIWAAKVETNAFSSTVIHPLDPIELFTELTLSLKELSSGKLGMYRVMLFSSSLKKFRIDAPDTLLVEFEQVAKKFLYAGRTFLSTGISFSLETVVTFVATVFSVDMEILL